MKNKLYRGLVLFICFLVFPILVQADVGMPEIKPYDVIVTKKEGILLEDSYNKKSLTIPYDTKLTVNMEYYNSDTKAYYGYVEYNGLSGEIDLSNVRIVSKQIDFKDFSKYDQPHEVYAINDIEMYKGPSKIYGRVDGDKVIPKGTTISYEYFDEVWAFVEYDGVEGWIVIYPLGTTVDIGIKTYVAEFAPEEGNTILLTEDIKKLKVDPTTKEEVNVNIPKGTVLKYEYSYSAVKAQYYYIDYEGTKGWLYITSFSGPYSADGLVEQPCLIGKVTSDSVYIYSKRGDLSSKTNRKLEKWAEYSIIYSYYAEDAFWYYIAYNDEKVWVAVENLESNAYSILEREGLIFVAETKEDIDVYEFPSKDAKKVSTLKSGTKVDLYYDYEDSTLKYEDEFFSWNYIKTGDVEGWVLSRKLDNSSNELKKICPVAEKTKTPEENDKKDEKETKENKSLTPAQMSVIGVGGAIVLALVVIVTLAIINKKKKNM